MKKSDFGGCFPKELPTQELLGNRMTNELTTLTINYTVSDYRETVLKEGQGHWLYSEFKDLIYSQYR